MIIIIMKYYIWNTGLYPARLPPPVYPTCILKYICSIILHLIMQPRVCDPIDRLRYVIHHPERFEQIFIPQLICWMKIVCEVGIEITLIVSTAYENDQIYLIMDFTALMVVYYIDSSYFESIKDPLKGKMMYVQEMKLPVTISLEPFTFKQLRIKGKKSLCYNLIMRIWIFMYETVYFHFLPYISMYYCYYGLISLT